MDIFVEPVLAQWLGRRPLELPEVEASLTRKITSPAGDDDYIRVAVGRVGEKLLAAPLARGAGVITSLVRADGLLVLPRGEQGAEAGQKVRVRTRALRIANWTRPSSASARMMSSSTCWRNSSRSMTGALSRPMSVRRAG